MSVAIGIDLGTTNTVIAAVVDGVAVTLQDEHGRRLLPSVVSFHPSGTVLVGEPARERRLIDPENTIFSIKPLLGRPWDSDEVKAAQGRFPFQLTQGAKNSTMVLARDVAYSLPEISAFVLRRAKAIAEKALGQPVDRAVITVPANFNELQRASTKIAGKLAGLEVMRILNEPTSAALAYGQSISKAEKIAVYDLGGGTFDVTLLDLTGNVFEVLATAGDTALGGDDIDRILAERIAFECMRRFNIDPRTSPGGAARLAFIAEELKKELSSAPQAHREIGGVGYTEGGHPIAMPFAITREELEKLLRPLIDRTIAVARQSIEIIGLSPRDFDRVILVGGSTRIPLVTRMVEQLFVQPPHLKVNPDEVVALGAAIQAHALNQSKGAHRRNSAHAQLAKAKATGDQVPTRPPHADPTRGPVDVPRAPKMPTVGAAAGAPVPEFFSFNKAPAVISFSQVPPPANAAGAQPPPPQASPPRPPPVPSVRTPTQRMHSQPVSPPVPQKAPPPPGPAPSPRRGQTEHAASVSTQASIRPIDGRPASRVDDAVVGPKPARSAAARVTPEAAQSEIAPDSDLMIPVERSPSSPFAHSPPTAPPHAASGVHPSPGAAQVVQGNMSLEAIVARPVMPEPTAQQFRQGSAITTSAATPLLIDVTPLSLGVEIVGGYTDVLIQANSPVPCEKTRTFLTASDNQTTVSIRVAQGESSRFADNTRLGDLELSGLRRSLRGQVKIAVTFELDADGILSVRARDQDTGRETTATMRLLGANTDAADVSAMAERQARHIVA